MRKLIRTKFGGYKDVDVGGIVSCPLAYDQERAVFNCCQDDCAWFQIKNSKDNTTDIKICFCGTKVIGQLVKGESK